MEDGKLDNEETAKKSHPQRGIKKATKIAFGVKSINPILSAIAGGILLYFAQQYFDRDRIQIVDASIRIKKIELQVGSKLVDSLRNIVSNYYDRAESSNKLSTDQLIGYIRADLQMSYSYQNEIKMYQGFILQNRKIKKIIKGKDTIGKEDTTAQNAAYYREIELFNSKIHDLSVLKNSLFNSIKKQILLNKNNFFIEVIVQNTGNKQGIIKYKAVLQIDETSINLSKSDEETPSNGSAQNNGQLLNSFLTVEAHSFNGLSFDIDNYFNKPGDIEIAKKEFEVGQKKCKIILYSVDNKQIAEFEFLCRDDLSRNENGPLLQYLKDNNFDID